VDCCRKTPGCKLTDNGPGRMICLTRTSAARRCKQRGSLFWGGVGGGGGGVCLVGGGVWGVQKGGIQIGGSTPCTLTEYEVPPGRTTPLHSGCWSHNGL